MRLEGRLPQHTGHPGKGEAPFLPHRKDGGSDPSSWIPSGTTRISLQTQPGRGQERGQIPTFY